MRRWPAAVGVVAVAVATVGVAAGSGAEAAQNDVTTSTSQRIGPKDRVVTLITGDRVVVVGGDLGKVRVERGEGRGQVTFQLLRSGGKLVVLPSDVSAEVASGKLDRRLFEVSTLLQFGYDDAHTQSTPLIVTYTGERSAARALSLQAATIRQDLPAVNGAALSVPKNTGAQFLQQLAPQARSASAGAIAKIWLDGKRQIALDQSVPQIGAPTAWKAGFTGKGITVAVLDTGIDATHPDFKGKITAEKNFTTDNADDNIGHGTHVASTIAGTAAASKGKYKGVAPDAKLLDGKVCAGDGCDESAMLAGMQWAAVDQKAKIINLSIGGPDTPRIDPLEEAVNRLSAQTGALFVICAGNEGEDGGHVDSPGSADSALTVGAVDKKDQFAPFSNPGPRIGDGAIKPDVTAPGVAIVAAKSNHSTIGTPVGKYYLQLDGTSMATPHVAGSAALLLQEHPSWTAEDLKSALMGTAKVLPKQSVFQQGAGRIDVAKAIADTVVAVPGSVSFGTQLWPHTTDKPVVKNVEYRNLGTKPVTLTLTTAATGPDGKAAPTEVLSVSPSTLTIPAGGKASVAVTSDTRKAAVGMYTGQVVATGTGQRVASPFQIGKERESYDLALKHLLPNGKATDQIVSGIISLDNGSISNVEVDAQGNGKVRLPKGRYVVDATINGEADTQYNLVWPMVNLNHPVNLVADAKLARPFGFKLPAKDAKLTELQVGYSMTSPAGVFENLHATADLSKLYTATLGAPAPTKDFVGYTYSRWGRPAKSAQFVDSPYSYNLMQGVRGRYVTGYNRIVNQRSLATVTTQYTADQPGGIVSDLRLGSLPGTQQPTEPEAFLYHLPAKVVQYFDPGTQWSANIDRDRVVAGAPDPLVTLLSETIYQRGKSYVETWGGAVAAPALDGLTRRTGNEIDTNLSPNTDRDGHVGIATASGGTSTTKLFRNGKLVASEDTYGQLTAEGQPTGKASYRLEYAQKIPAMQLATQLNYVWTFTSAGTGTKTVPLPLWGTQFRPGVDLNNSVRRTATTSLPFVVKYQPKAPVGTFKAVSVWVSGDGGKTWTKATVVSKRHGNYVASFKTPATAKLIALKSVVTDKSGNTATQTITNAYHIH
ncbi:S8 family peptidase [Kribbella sp. NPDC055071]